MEFKLPYIFKHDKKRILLSLIPILLLCLTPVGIGYLIYLKHSHIDFLFGAGGISILCGGLMVWLCYRSDWTPWKLTIDSDSLTAMDLRGHVTKIFLKNIFTIDKSFYHAVTSYWISDANNTIRMSRCIIPDDMYYKIMEGFIKPHLLRNLQTSTTEDIVVEHSKSDRITSIAIVIFFVGFGIWFVLDTPTMRDWGRLVAFGVVWGILTILMAWFAFTEFHKYIVTTEKITDQTPLRIKSYTWSQIQKIEFLDFNNEKGNTHRIVLHIPPKRKIAIYANGFCNFGRLDAFLRIVFHQEKVDLLDDYQFSQKEKVDLTTRIRALNVFALLALVALVYGWTNFYPIYKELKTLKKEARITEATITSKSDGKFEYEFTAENRKFIGKCAIHTKFYSQYSIGDTVQVGYLPSNPNISRVKDIRDKKDIVLYVQLAVGGGLFFIVSTLGSYGLRKKYRNT